MPYQPDYNPCESCLSKVKGFYKREKLKYIVKNEEVECEKLIKEAILCVGKPDIVNAIEGSLKLINK